jgi:predicted ATPase
MVPGSRTHCESSLVASEAAKVLGIQEEPGRSVTQTICTRLHNQNLLIIFDNCEHLIGAPARLATALLREVPGLRIIATSREPLDIPGEQSCTVLPMSVPDRAAGMDVLVKCDAM